MSGFVRESMQNSWGKFLVGLVAAVILSGLYWHFVPDTSVAKLIYLMLLAGGAYKYYMAEFPA